MVTIAPCADLSVQLAGLEEGEVVVAGRVVPLRCSVEAVPGLRTVAWLRDGLLLATRPLTPRQGRLEDTLQLGLHTRTAETVVECRPSLVEAGFDNNDMAASVSFSVEEEEEVDEQDYEDEDNREEDEDANDEYKEASDEDGDDDKTGIEEDSSSEEDDDDNNDDYDVPANNTEIPDVFNQYNNADASDHDRDVPPEDAVTEQYEELEHSVAPNVAATDAATELEISSDPDEASAAATHLGGETEEDYYEDQYEEEDDYEDEGEEYDYEAATYDYYSGVNADMHVVHKEAQKSSAADTREEITLTDEESEDHKSTAEAEAEEDATNPITSGQTRPAQLESSQDNVAVVSEPKSLKNTRRSSAETTFRHSATYFQTCVLILIMKTIT